MQEAIDQEAFKEKLSTMLALVHPDHKPAFEFIFSHAQTFLDPVQAEYLALITALAITESNKRYQALETKKGKLRI